MQFNQLPVNERANWILSHSQKCWACVPATVLPHLENTPCTACELWSNSCKTRISGAHATIWAGLKSLENREDGAVVHVGEGDIQCQLDLLELLKKVETAIKGKQNFQDKFLQEDGTPAMDEHVDE